MVLPLFHNSLPLTASSACRTVNDEFEAAKTTPLITIGARGAVTAAVQPARGTGTSALPEIIQEVIMFLEGATIHRVPAVSCQLATGPVTSAGSATPVKVAASTICKWSGVATAIMSLELYSNTTGDEINVL